MEIQILHMPDVEAFGQEEVKQVKLLNKHLDSTKMRSLRLQAQNFALFFIPSVMWL